MDEIIKGLKFGVKVTWWILKSIYVGYMDVIRWGLDWRRGVYYPFPVLRLLVAILLTIFLFWFNSLGDNQQNQLNQSSTRTNQSQLSSIYATSTTVAVEKEKARFSISPTVQEVVIGDIFTVEVKLKPGNNRVEDFGFRLKFPHQHLKVINFEAKSLFGDSQRVMSSEVGAEAIRLRLACGSPCTSYIEEEAVVAAITFESLSDVPKVLLTFDQKDQVVNRSSDNVQRGSSGQINLIHPPEAMVSQPNIIEAVTAIPEPTDTETSTLSPTLQSQPFIVMEELIYFDLFTTQEVDIIGPVTGEAILTKGRQYYVVISGTYSEWEIDKWQSTCKGTPESSPAMASAQTSNGPVGADVLYTFAVPSGADNCQSLKPPPLLHTDQFEFSLDGGKTWSDITNHVLPEPTYVESHNYYLEVFGEGFPFAFRKVDKGCCSTDNYGVLTITYSG